MARPAETLERPVTAEELLRTPDDGLRRELIRGEVRTMAPAGHRHGWIAVNFSTALAQHVRANGSGRVYAAETGFKLASNPDTVRAPDVAFVSRARVEEAGETSAYFPGAPDLAVEVLSPEDRYAEVEQKVFDWIDAGARMVVVVSPESRSLTVYRSRSLITVLTEDEVLDGADVVPGWSLPVREIFA